MVIIPFLAFSGRALAITKDGACLLVAVLCMFVYLLAPHYALAGLVIGRSLDDSVTCLFLKALAF